MAPTKNPKQRHLSETIRESTVRPHPSVGGARGYSVDMRQVAVAARINGIENSAEIQQLRQQGLFPCAGSIDNWQQRIVTHVWAIQIQTWKCRPPDDSLEMTAQENYRFKICMQIENGGGTPDLDLGVLGS